jgi:hypothetical protein
MEPSVLSLNTQIVEEEEKNRKVCVIRSSSCDDVFNVASEILHSTAIKCFHSRAEYICVLGDETSTSPLAYVHTC